MSSFGITSESDRFIIFHFTEVINQRSAQSVEKSHRMWINPAAAAQTQLGHENLVRPQRSDLIGARGDVWLKLSASRNVCGDFPSSLAPRPKVCPHRWLAKDRAAGPGSHLTTIFFDSRSLWVAGDVWSCGTSQKWPDTSNHQNYYLKARIKVSFA